MKLAHWSHYDDGTYPSAEELPWPAMTLREACLWRAYIVDILDGVDDLPEHADQLIKLHDIARGYTISPLTNVLVPVPVEQVQEFVRSTMIYTTQIARLDGLVLVASTDDSNVSQLSEFKQQIRTIIKTLGPSAEPRAHIEGDAYTMHYVIDDSLVFICITEGSYPKKLAFTYLEDVRKEFQGSYKSDDYLSPSLRPYAYAEFERFLERTKKLYQDSRAQDNMHRLNDELKDVHKAMTKNINDLLYRGDSLDKMGDMSSRLREDSAKYKRAAVRINWELLLKQYGPIAGIATIIILFLFWRFFW